MVSVTDDVARKFSSQIIYIGSSLNSDLVNNVNSSMWSNIEVNVGIICASLQTIRPILTRCFPRLFSSSSHQGGYERNTGPRDGAPFDRHLSSTAQFELSNKIESGGPKAPPKAGMGAFSNLSSTTEEKHEGTMEVVVTQSIVRHVESRNP